MNLAQRSHRNAYIAQRRIRGADVIYTGDDDASIQIRVIPAETNPLITNSETNTQIRDTVRDYRILREDLEIDDELFWPKAGHTITEADESTYEVVRDMHGKPGVHWDDEQTKQVVRVHTQLIAGT